MSQTWGVDASDYDWSRGPMDVAAMVRDGISFFTHKATEGTTIRHVHYGEAMTRALGAGMPLMGAYMVVRTPGSNGNGPVGDQVDYLLSYLDAATPWWRSMPEFFLQVDLEHWGYDNVAPAYGVQACDLLRQKTGKWVVLYAPRWSYGDTIPDDGTPLWASAYGTNPAEHYPLAYPGDTAAGWAAYSGRTPFFLQFGSRLTVGSQPGCDVNAYRGSLTQLRALITGGDMPTLDATDLGRIAMAVQLGRTDMGNLWGQPDVPAVFADIAGHTGADLAAAIGEAIKTAAAPTQEQVNAAVLAAMLDPRVQKGVGDAIAAHLHVN